MNPDGKLDLGKQNDMIVSYTLLRDGGVWRATQVDLHNVEKMDLPFSNAGQKPSGMRGGTMLTAQSANPDVALRPFIHWYVQRETLSKNGEIVEPVFRAQGDVGVSVCDVLRRKGIWDGTTSPVLGNNSHRANRFTQHAAHSAKSCAVAGRAFPAARAVSLVWGADLTFDGSRTEGHAVFGSQVSGLYQRLGNIVNFADRVKVLDRFFLDRLLRSDALSRRHSHSACWSPDEAL